MSQRRDRKGLGRGLSALMADLDVSSDAPAQQADATDMPQGSTMATAERGAREIPIDRITANPDQPRRHFAEEALDELAASIREKGIIQPLILRPDPHQADHYQIVAGERRWRAAQRAQLHDVPAIVRTFDDTEVLEVAIIENIQRADLNAVEEAQGYRQLMDRFDHTQEQLAQAMGKSRSHIANLMRLLTLPDEVLDMLRDGRLSAGHARALITIDDPLSLAQEAVRKSLSVREVEKRAQAGAGKAQKTNKTSPAKTKDADTKALEGDLSAALGMPVTIDHTGVTGGGKLSISYKDLEDLDDLIRKLNAT